MSNRPPIEKICANCGKSFLIWQCLIDRGSKGICCSRKCIQELRIKNQQTPCEHCGKMFVPRPSDTRNGGGKFCSHECSMYGRRKKISVTCRNCNKVFKVWPSYIKRGDGIFCSIKCTNEYNTAQHHYAWRGGRLEYRGENWGRQRADAFKRDNGTCQICHKKSPKKRENEVHHIKPFRDFNGDYIQANDLRNLITLCTKCHRRAERGLLSVPVHLL